MQGEDHEEKLTSFGLLQLPQRPLPYSLHAQVSRMRRHNSDRRNSVRREEPMRRGVRGDRLTSSTSSLHVERGSFVSPRVRRFGREAERAGRAGVGEKDTPSDIRKKIITGERLEPSMFPRLLLASLVSSCTSGRTPAGTGQKNVSVETNRRQTKVPLVGLSK